MFRKFNYSNICYYLANHSYTHTYDIAYNIKYILTWNVGCTEASGPGLYSRNRSEHIFPSNEANDKELFSQLRKC